MDVTQFRSRLRRTIFDEDVRIPVISIQYPTGYTEVTASGIVGYSPSSTTIFTVNWVTASSYDSMISSIRSNTGWVVEKLEACVGTDDPYMEITPKTSVETAVEFSAKHFFSDVILDDFTNQAISQWNDYFETSYTTIAQFPESKSIPISYLVASMVFAVRAVRDAVSFYEYNKAGKITQVSLGGELSISKENIKVDDDGKSQPSWKYLADWYDRKFYKYCESASDRSAFPEIQEIEKQRVVASTGRLPYKLDRGLPSTESFAGVASTPVGGLSTVTLTWSRSLSMQFAYYGICRDDVEIYRTYDNQVYTYDDEDLVAGSYVYKVTVYDKNEIESVPVEITVVVT